MAGANQRIWCSICGAHPFTDCIRAKESDYVGEDHLQCLLRLYDLQLYRAKEGTLELDDLVYLSPERRKVLAQLLLRQMLR